MPSLRPFAAFSVPSATLVPTNKDAKLVQTVRTALTLWQQETDSPQHEMPTDTRLRLCPVARHLRLSSLIIRAGGYRRVSQLLNLAPSPSQRIQARQRELVQLSQSLYHLCEINGLAAPHVSFPPRGMLRRIDPLLANRIAAFPNRAGYTALQKFIQDQSPSQPQPDAPDITPSPHAQLEVDIDGHQANYATPEPWGQWTNIEHITTHLARYQIHPRVMPLLRDVPPFLVGAIQRQGGSFEFAKRANLVTFKNYDNVRRFTNLVQWLASQTHPKGIPSDCWSTPYIDEIQSQCQNPPTFPPSLHLRQAGFYSELTRFGGRKFLALRLGYDRQDSIPGLFMGPFSVHFAADMLLYAVDKVIPSPDCSVSMPSSRDMDADDMSHLNEAVRVFGGEAVVGRRLGLVTQIL